MKTRKNTGIRLLGLALALLLVLCGLGACSGGRRGKAGGNPVSHHPERD